LKHFVTVKNFYSEGLLAPRPAPNLEDHTLSVVRDCLFNIFAVTIHTRRRMRWAGHVARMAEGRGVYRILGGRPEGKRPLGRPKRRWKGNIKMDLRDIGIDGANWIRLAHDRVQWRAFVNTVMNLRIP